MQNIKQTKTLVKSVLPSALVAKIQKALFMLSISRIHGFDLYLNSPNRYVLEDVIIPYFVACKDLHKILFIGCDWYTKPYNKYFKNKEYWTLEIDKSKKKYGAKRHISDSLQNIKLYFSTGYLDLIFCNGVFGHGMDSREETEESINQCFHHLRDGGILLFGWNDIPECRPFPVIEESQSLKKFEPYFFPPLSSSQYLTPDDSQRHTFNFYRKPHNS